MAAASMNKVKISTAEVLVLLLLLSTAQALPCPPCYCEPLEDHRGWVLDCSSMGLKEMPLLSTEVCHSCHTIKILHLQNNSLTTVPPGALDNLIYLKEVDFSNNPWHCDCSILYFKQWLEDFSVMSLANLKCASPASVKARALSQLSGNELEACRKPLPIKCLDFFWRDFALIFAAIMVLILASCILRYSEKLASRAARKQHYSEIPLL
ncbi:platelet glycoprotein IX-like [Rhineura floridana]|uniref:platelet glycoprotein IX-like n=1 Tax=Rhineura floridana TaxID=261503 RepID=UPI002AC8236A|nr:platelet glycoprotein IX-like [Rhineura floridana]